MKSFDKLLKIRNSMNHIDWLPIYTRVFGDDRRRDEFRTAISKYEDGGPYPYQFEDDANEILNIISRYMLKESKTNKNMKKNVVKINENTLRQIVAESVKKVLKESCWYGDETPFKTIISAANEIMDKFDYTQDDNYDDTGDCDGPDIVPQIYKWAKEVAENAEYWLRCNSDYTSINGGEDW